MLKQVRQFLDGRGLIEVTTNNLVPVGAFEASLDVLKVGNLGELHTSPEIEMKRLLSESPLSMYQICKCYRDDPDTGIHLKEFTMLEYYRVGADYRVLIQDMRELLQLLAGRDLPFREIPMRELVEHDGLSQDEFYRALVTAETRLDPEIPTIVTEWPAFATALVTERFEIYWKKMELCNGGTELVDKAELDRRFAAEAKHREAEGKPPHAYPKILVEALAKGLPPCAGVAVGLDRVFWAITADLESRAAHGKRI